MLRISGGALRGRKLRAPRSADVRPTASKVRQAVFDVLQQRVAGAAWLDAFAGSGAMGIEALSRGAAHATFVEEDAQAFRVLEANVRDLGLWSRARLLRRPAAAALALLAAERAAFDVAFLDPPYALDPAPLIDLVLGRGLVRPHGVIVLEMAARRSLALPPGARVRRYGDTALVTIAPVEIAEPEAPAPPI